ncbi:MAG: FHA domain-containing protein [Lachnospiraceae bacterium]|nr:FHA domain-containing protein [Lachnospiraceae bacterium]MBP5263634.1 FHA domain-containing protein [Lachnospiraceae bacterium]MBP5669600.1 FHA domain-containing protein [Lachnospiraceae bacterium]
MEILKSAAYVLIGFVIGAVVFSPLDTILKVVFIIALLCVLCAAFFGFMVFDKGKKPAVTPQRPVRSSSGTSVNERPVMSEQGARISRNAQVMQENVSRSMMQEQQMNPLDRKPRSVEKREQYEKTRQPASKVVLLNEEGTPLMEWSLQSQTSLIIGKSTDKEPVDIDLSGSAVAQMISKQHAVLNYTDKGWFIDDIDSKNGTRVKKASQNAIMDVKLVGAIEVERGDIIYIASTMLQIQ